ncbi:MAG: 6-phosphofructokinase [Mycoplasmataceae bacterium]|nr:6-phosphofructokinase [Mycoplasmataceae bacterium]
MSKKIAILTSGGDSQGMNAAVVAAVKSSWAKGHKPYLVYEGYKGLIENKIVEAKPELINGMISRGGTFLGSARLPEFAELKVRQKAVKVLEKIGIDSLIVIGGDGSYMGAAKLAEMGINTVGLPGTIDNDIASTDWTIGFDTSLGVVVDSIDKIRDTSESHRRAMVIEVMGRYCGDLAIYGALSTGAEILSVPESKLSEEQIIKKVNELKDSKRSLMIVVTEHMYDVNKLAKKIQEKTGVESRAHVLGYTQRGGIPTPKDRILASLLAEEAVNRIEKNEKGICLGMIGEEIKSFDILEAVKMKNPDRTDLIKRVRKLI